MAKRNKASKAEAVGGLAGAAAAHEDVDPVVMGGASDEGRATGDETAGATGDQATGEQATSDAGDQATGEQADGEADAVTTPPAPVEVEVVADPEAEAAAAEAEAKAKRAAAYAAQEAIVAELEAKLEPARKHVRDVAAEAKEKKKALDEAIVASQRELYRVVGEYNEANDVLQKMPR